MRRDNVNETFTSIINVADRPVAVGLTNDMIKNIQSPGALHSRLVTNVLNSTRISFQDDQGYINAKDF